MSNAMLMLKTALNRFRKREKSPAKQTYPQKRETKLWKMLKTLISFEHHCGNLQFRCFVKI